MWVEQIRDWVIGSNNMFLASLEIKLSHHVNNQNDYAVPVNSSVGRHLLSNQSCAETYPDDNFRILCKCRSAIQQKVMEAIYIKLTDPDLYQQKEFVLQLSLL